MLEIAVHIDVPTNRYYVEIDIPDDIEMLEFGIEDLPENWHSKPPILEPQYIENDFVLQKSGAILKVPSSIVHPEFNYLINPNHPDSAKIKVISSQNLTFDIRFKK